MAKELRRVALTPETDLLRVVEDVNRDKEPRLIEREGEVLAVVLFPEDYPATRSLPTSKRRKKELLSLAGTWSDLDADGMIKDLYKARHEAPASRPLDA
jgi:hypothetical protein